MEESINEKNIISEILHLNSQFASFLAYTKHSIDYITSKVEKMDNNFFNENEEIITSLYKLYNYDHIDEMIHNIDENTKRLNDNLDFCCEKHHFIDDYIDTTFGSNLKITYCRLCNVSKK